ncbi:hypothetical protein LINPERPRIM_LOCUS41266 [Linum perenne]
MECKVRAILDGVSVLRGMLYTRLHTV